LDADWQQSARAAWSRELERIIGRGGAKVVSIAS
jgi:hypothetical protein